MGGEFSINKKVILIFHKPLFQIDGQIKYVKSLIKSLSLQYEVEIPSEEFFKSRKEINSWVVRTLLVNSYLIFWVLKNRDKLKNTHFICIMEDRYTIFPTYLAVKLTHIKLVSRISDWGDNYISSMPNNNLLYYLMGLLNKIYEKFVITYSGSIIVPSDFVYKQISKIYKKNICYYLLPYEFSPPPNSGIINDIVFTDNEHDIYCILVGNYNYKPNEESADFLINQLAGQVNKVDQNIKFLLVGSGSLEKYSPYNSSNILALGLVPDLSQVYAKCSIGINPSLTRGGTSIKNIEYLVNGMYVVTTPQASIGVIESTNMFVYDRKDFSRVICELAKKIREGKIIHDEKEIEKIRERYSESKISNDLLKFLESD